MTDTQTEKREMTREEFEREKKNDSLFGRLVDAGIKFEDVLKYRKRREEIERRYPDNSGKLNAFRGSVESAQNLVDFTSHSYFDRTLTSTMGILMYYITLNGLLSSPVEHEGLARLVLNNHVMDTLGAYILLEGVTMSLSGRFAPVGLGLMNYAGKIVEYTKNFIRRGTKNEKRIRGTTENVGFSPTTERRGRKE